MNKTAHQGPLGLLAQRRFGPLFATQFLGAFNDNVLKNALVLLLAFHTGTVLGLQPAAAVQVAAGLFILPFFLFSAMAGQLADKYEKTQIIRIVKAVEIAIALLATAGFATHHVELLLGALFLMGLHSTFFGPIKYSILPQHLYADELVAGNAWVESGTFVAILAGSVLAGLLVAAGENGPVYAGVTCVIVAVLGYISSRAIPPALPSVPNLKVSLNPFTETVANIRLARRNGTVFHALIGISWFWFYGAIFLSQFAPYVKEVLGGDGLLATALLATFIVGIAAGSFLCERLSGKQVEIGLVPLGSIGLTVFGIDLWWVSPATSAQITSVAAFFADSANWRLLFDLVMIGVSGGFYTVPLYALIQERSEAGQRSRVIAANNILNAAFMVVSALFALFALQLGASIAEIFLITALMNVAVALYVYKRVPEFFMRFIVWLLVHSIYRLRVEGREHLPEEGTALLVCNHVSYVDALVIAAACRRPIRFVMDHSIYRTPIVHFVAKENRAIPIAGGREDADLLAAAFDEIDSALQAGDLVGLFPEGRLTPNGEIGPFKGGVARIVSRTPAPVIPMALSGLWDSAFSRQPRSRFLRLLGGIGRRVTLRIGPAIAAENVALDTLQAGVATLRGKVR